MMAYVVLWALFLGELLRYERGPIKLNRWIYAPVCVMSTTYSKQIMGKQPASSLNRSESGYSPLSLFNRPGVKEHERDVQTLELLRSTDEAGPSGPIRNPFTRRSLFQTAFSSPPSFTVWNGGKSPKDTRTQRGIFKTMRSRLSPRRVGPCAGRC